MPTLVIENVPTPLFDRIQDLVKTKRRSTDAAIIKALEHAVVEVTATRVEAPLPSEPFLTEEICAPCSIPRPKGTPARTVHVNQPRPTPHDIADEER